MPSTKIISHQEMVSKLSKSRFFILHHIIYIIGAKSSTQRERFFFTRFCQLGSHLILIQNAYQMVLFLEKKTSFLLSLGSFLAKNQKIFSVVKIRNYNEKVLFFSKKKKRFHLFKSLFNKNVEAQNMPVVARCLV